MSNVAARRTHFVIDYENMTAVDVEAAAIPQCLARAFIGPFDVAIGTMN